MVRTGEDAQPPLGMLVSELRGGTGPLHSSAFSDLCPKIVLNSSSPHHRGKDHKVRDMEMGQDLPWDNSVFSQPGSTMHTHLLHQEPGVGLDRHLNEVWSVDLRSANRRQKSKGGSKWVLGKSCISILGGPHAAQNSTGAW